MALHINVLLKSVIFIKFQRIIAELFNGICIYITFK